MTHSRTGSGALASAARTTYNAGALVVATDVYAPTGEDITSVPSGAQTTRSYFDALGRVDSILNPGSRTATGSAYKARKQSWALRDGFGNPRWEYPGNGMYRSYIYNTRGNPTRIEDGPGWTNQSQDGERRADDRTKAWVDSMQLTMGKAISNGAVHQLVYDAKGRLISSASDDPYLPDTSVVNRTYAYSKGDQLIFEQVFFPEMGGAYVIRRFEYDRRGQRTKVVDSVTAPGVVSAEKVDSIRYFHANATGRLDSIVGWLTGGVKYAKVRFAYDRGGRDTLHMVRVDTGPDSVITRTSYNALGLVGGLTTTGGGVTRYLMSSPIYNGVGDLTSYTSTEPGSGNGAHTYGYSTDGTRRLLTANEGATGHSYSYDVYGNRLTEAASSSFGGHGLCTLTLTNNYDTDNRIMRQTPASLLAPCKKMRYFTDQAGRRVGESDTTAALPPGLPPIGGLRSLMTYTAGGQLYFSVTASGDLTQTDFNWHWYDAQGRRVMSQMASRSSIYPWPHPDSVGSGRTYYIYDGSDVALELVRSGGTWSVDRRFITGGLDRQLIVRQSISGAPKSLALVVDRNGSPVRALRPDGTLESSPAYFSRDAFGALIGLTGSGGQPMGGVGYAGAGTPNARGGFVYFRNRWYDPQTGRFLTQDPIGLAGGVNLYAFAGNNPISFSDPFGLDCTLTDRSTCKFLKVTGSIGLTPPGARFKVGVADSKASIGFEAAATGQAEWGANGVETSAKLSLGFSADAKATIAGYGGSAKAGCSMTTNRTGGCKGGFKIEAADATFSSFRVWVS